MTEVEVKQLMQVQIDTTLLHGDSLDNFAENLRNVSTTLATTRSIRGVDLPALRDAFTRMLQSTRKLAADERMIVELLRGELAKMNGASAEEVAAIDKRTREIEALTRR